MTVRQLIVHITRLAFLWLLAFLLLNLSVDSIDFKPMFTANLSEFNDLNSITEYISEVVLGHSNAFPESAKKTNTKSQSIKHVDLKIHEYQGELQTPDNRYISLLCYGFHLDDTYSYLFSKEINPPPPKV